MAGRTWWGAAAVMALLVAACGGDDGEVAADDGPPAAAGEVTEVGSDRPRATPNVRMPADVIGADTDFALDLYREITAAAPDDGLVMSPYSVSVAVSMVLAGADGDTRSQIAEVLGVDDETTWHQARNTLDQALLEPRSAEGSLQPLEMSILNSAWGQGGYPFESDYLDLLAESYGAGMRTVDFVEQPEPSRVAINEWAEDATEGRIVELIPPSSIDELTRLVLVNAIHFRANWIHQFDPSDTTDGSFTTSTGETVTAPMMSAEIRTLYAEDDGWAAVRLPYAGAASMIVIAPDEGTLPELVADLDTALLDEVRQSLSDHLVDLEMPRFEISSDIGLVEPLRALGIVDAFQQPTPDSGADFTRMTVERELFLSDALQRADITVDEEGTEASAATAMIVGIVSRPPEADLTLDRPFVFVIQDDATGSILFIGHVTDPSTA